MKIYNFCSCYSTPVGALILMAMLFAHLHELEVLAIRTDPTKVCIAGVLSGLFLVCSFYAAKAERRGLEKDETVTVEKLQKQLFFLYGIVIPNLIQQIHKVPAIIQSYEQSITHYKSLASSFSTELMQNISTQLELAIAIAQENKKTASTTLDSIQQHALDSKRSLVQLSEAQKNILETLNNKDSIQKSTKQKVTAFPIVKDYHNIFDSIQKAIMPRHSFKDVLEVLQSTYPESSPFEGEQYRFYFGDKVIKERIGHAYKGEIKLSTLEKEFSVYRKSKK